MPDPLSSFLSCWGQSTAALNSVPQFLKSRQSRELELAFIDPHLAVLGAAVQGRYRLVRIQQERRIESALDDNKRGNFFGRKLHAHRIDFLDPDAVLAGD